VEVCVHIHGHGLGRAALAALLASAPLLNAPAAADWPQLWGPTVSGAVDAGGPEGAWQLRELWRRPIGSGYSAVTIVGDRGYTGESDGAHDHAVAFDVKTGKTLWRVPLGETHKGHDGSRDGPIATPAVSGGRVFMAGPRGTLVAIDAASGKELWRTDVLAVPRTKAPFYGFGSSPIVAGSRVVLQVGGDEKSGLAAFDAASGALAWTALPSETKGNSSGYTMAAPLTLGGQSLMVVTAHDRVFAVKAEDGSLAWSHPLAQPEEPQRAPLVLGEDRVLVPRGGSTVLISVARDGDAWKTTEAWTSPRLKGGLSPTVHDNNGSLFGFSGQYLLCVDAKTGEPRWREKTYSGTLIRVGRHLVVLGDASGVLRVAEAVPTGYKEVARANAFNAGSQSVVAPSYADGRIFVRNLEEMVAFAVSGGAGVNP
jgi:outer membrane protein assembly factor BamB